MKPGTRYPSNFGFSFSTTSLKFIHISSFFNSVFPSIWTLFICTSAFVPAIFHFRNPVYQPLLLACTHFFRVLHCSVPNPSDLSVFWNQQCVPHTVPLCIPHTASFYVSPTVSMHTSHRIISHVQAEGTDHAQHLIQCLTCRRYSVSYFGGMHGRLDRTSCLQCVLSSQLDSKLDRKLLGGSCCLPLVHVHVAPGRLPWERVCGFSEHMPSCVLSYAVRANALWG